MSTKVTGKARRLQWEDDVQRDDPCPSSMKLLGWAWSVEIARPLHKLLLLGYAGDGRTNIARGVSFTGAAREDVAAATRWLRREGYLPLPNDLRALADAFAPARATPRRKAISRAVRRRVMERDGYECQHCGTDEDLSVDHVQPVIAGGTNDEDNLQVLCRPCNSRKGATW